MVTGLVSVLSIAAAIFLYPCHQQLNLPFTLQADTASESQQSNTQDNLYVEQYLDLAHQIIDVWADQPFVHNKIALIRSHLPYLDIFYVVIQVSIGLLW